MKRWSIFGLSLGLFFLFYITGYCEKTVRQQSFICMADHEMALVTAQAPDENRFGEIYIEADDSVVEEIIEDLQVEILGKGQTVYISVEDLEIKSKGAASWRDDDGIDGNIAGVFTTFSHIEDLIKVNMESPVELESRTGIIPGLEDEGEKVFLEARISGLKIGIEKLNKVMALGQNMVTESRKFYSPGDIDPYSGLILNTINDRNHLLDNPDTAIVDPAVKYAETNEILGTFHWKKGEIIVGGVPDPQGGKGSSNPARAYIFVNSY